MAVKHGDWGKALGGVADVIEKEKDRKLKKDELDRNFDIREKTLKLAEAKQKYDLDPNNPLNRKHLADAKKAVMETAGRQKLYNSLTDANAAQDTQERQNAMMDPQADPNAQGQAVQGQRIDPNSTEALSLKARQAAALGNKPLQQSYDKAADRANQYAKTASTERAKRDQEAEGKIEADYDAADRDLHRLGMIEGLNEYANTGILSGTKDDMIGFANEFGLGEQMAKILDGSMGPAQARAAMESLTNELVVGMIGQGKFPANNFSDQDRKFIMAMFPKLRSLPGANRLVLKILIQDRKFNKMKGDRFQEWRAKNPNKGMREWRRHWGAYKNKHNTMGSLKKEAQEFIKKGGNPTAGDVQPAGKPNKDADAFYNSIK